MHWVASRFDGSLFNRPAADAGTMNRNKASRRLRLGVKRRMEWFVGAKQAGACGWALNDGWSGLWGQSKPAPAAGR